jgi:arylsulfatase
MGSDDPAYRGAIRHDVPTLPELLRTAGYRSYMAGKWHLDPANDPAGPDAPLARGFERYFGVMRGADDLWHPQSLAGDRERLPPPGAGFYLSDAISDAAAGFVRDHRARHPDAPFFLYVAYTAPHWPVQAPAEDIARFAGRYRAGWDALRRERAARVAALGLLPAGFEAAPGNPGVAAWQDAAHSGWQRARMRAYAGMVHSMDRGIGRLVLALQETGAMEDTLLVFLSDNGASPETLGAGSRWLRRIAGLWTPEHYGDDPAVEPGGPDNFQSYGRAWAGASNAPFRGYKAGLYEGGIRSPCIVHWPGGLRRPAGSKLDDPAHVTDLAATALALAGLTAPAQMDGRDLRPLLLGGQRPRDPLYWEHEGWRAVRDGDLKLVARWRGPWELYDLAADPTELHDLAAARPEEVVRLAGLWQAWAARAGVRPWPWWNPLIRNAVLALLGVGVVLLALLLRLGVRALARR